MAITTFDTHKFVRRLEEAGMPLKLAEVQAEVLTEAFNVNLESLVTKDYLAARFAESDARWDRRFAELLAAIDSRFAEQDVKWERRFAEQDVKWEQRFAEMDVKWEQRFAAMDVKWEGRFAPLSAEVKTNFRYLLWSQAIIIAAVILPYLERLLAL